MGLVIAITTIESAIGSRVDIPELHMDVVPIIVAAWGSLRGFEEGMREVPQGDRILITMKPELAYGERGSPPDIGPGATLTFEVELLDVVPAPKLELEDD